jgi:AcrR family transcriptional regulator
MERATDLTSDKTSRFAEKVAARRAENGRIKRARTREALLRAAFEVLGHESGRNAQIDDVLAKAGMSRGTFYNYFVSREDLLHTVSFELSHHFDVGLEHTADPPTRTSFALRTYLRQAWQDRQWGWAIVNISLGGPVILGAATYRYATGTVQAGIDSGDFPIPNVRHGLDLLAGSSLMAMISLLRDEVSVEYIEEITLVILMGLGVARKKAEAVVRVPLPVLSSNKALFTMQPMEPAGR